MSNYVCFGVRAEDGNETIVIDAYSGSSKMYGRMRDATVWCEDAKEFTNKVYYAVKDEIESEIREYRKAIDMYNDLLHTHAPSENLFDYAKSKQEMKEAIEELKSALAWLNFFIGLECKKMFWFE